MIERLNPPCPAPPLVPVRASRPARPEAESRNEIRCRLERDLAGRASAYGPDGRRRVPLQAMFVATYC
jgi:hypothetical protein